MTSDRKIDQPDNPAEAYTFIEECRERLGDRIGLALT